MYLSYKLQVLILYNILLFSRRINHTINYIVDNIYIFVKLE